MSNQFLLTSFLSAMTLVSALMTESDTHKHVLEGSSATLKCPFVHQEAPSSIKWFSPNGTHITDGQDDKISVDSDWNLIVNETKPKHAGEYVCVMERPVQVYRSAIVTLEVVPEPVPLTAWEENKPRLVRGGISAGILIFAIGSVCIIYQNRWRKPKSKLADGDCFDGGRKTLDDELKHDEEKMASSSLPVDEEAPSWSPKDEPVAKHSPSKIQVQYAVVQEQEVGCAIEMDGRNPQSPSEDLVHDAHEQLPTTSKVQIQYAAEQQISAGLDDEIPDLSPNEPKSGESPNEIPNAPNHAAETSDLDVAKQVADRAAGQDFSECEKTPQSSEDS